MENNSTISSPPSSSMVSRIVILIMRVLTFVFLFIALILIAINQETEVASDVEFKIKFNDLYSYRYFILHFDNDFLILVHSLAVYSVVCHGITVNLFVY